MPRHLDLMEMEKSSHFLKNKPKLGPHSHWVDGERKETEKKAIKQWLLYPLSSNLIHTQALYQVTSLTNLLDGHHFKISSVKTPKH